MATGAKSPEDLNGSKKNGASTSTVTEEEEGDAAEPIFPADVVIEILCRLSLRSLAKLQLVCKEWRGFIRGRYLMERNADHREVICHLRNVAVRADPNKRDSDYESMELLDGRDGLLLVKSGSTDSFAIWNPATRYVLHLPDPHKDAFGVTFHYVKSTGNYIVFSMYRDESGSVNCELLTPGQSESWRPLPFPDASEAEGRREKQPVQVVSIGGVVHIVLIFEVGSTVTRKVVSLDLETEFFTVTCFSKPKFNNFRTLWAIDWNGKLALTTLVESNLHVTELEDYKKQRWSEKDKIIPLSFLQQETQAGAWSVVPLLAKDGAIWFNFEGDKILVYTIATGRSRPIKSRGLPASGKMYPYKPTLVGFPGMQQDPQFGKRFTSSLNIC